MQHHQQEESKNNARIALGNPFRVQRESAGVSLNWSRLALAVSPFVTNITSAAAAATNIIITNDVIRKFPKRFRVARNVGH